MDKQPEAIYIICLFFGLILLAVLGEISQINKKEWGNKKKLGERLKKNFRPPSSILLLAY